LGGAGKSTTAVLLATELAGQGAPLTLIDADVTVIKLLADC
jgi:cellulose biosynthesis protein BcsQ